jgi:hypothetical protein
MQRVPTSTPKNLRLKTRIKGSIEKSQTPNLSFFALCRMQEEEEREDEEAVRLAGGIDAYIPGKKILVVSYYEAADLCVHAACRYTQKG